MILGELDHFPGAQKIEAAISNVGVRHRSSLKCDCRQGSTHAAEFGYRQRAVVDLYICVLDCTEQTLACPPRRRTITPGPKGYLHRHRAGDLPTFVTAYTIGNREHCSVSAFDQMTTGILIVRALSANVRERCQIKGQCFESGTGRVRRRLVCTHR